jgi:HAMP domain-containing protein
LSKDKDLLEADLRKEIEKMNEEIEALKKAKEEMEKGIRKSKESVK